MKNIVFYNRSSVHYRQSIYSLLEKELNVDFYFGNSRPGNIKEIDKDILKNVRGNLINIKIYGPLYYQKGVFSLLKKYQIFITPGDYWCISNWFFLFICKLTKKEVYLWTHGWYGSENKIEKILKKIYYSFVTGFFLYGNYAKELMQKNGIRADKLHVIYNSLDYAKQLKLRNNMEIESPYRTMFGNNYNVLVFVGRLAKVKKLDMLIKAMFLLKQKKEYYNLLLIGDGDMKSELIDLVKSDDLLSQVCFYGACYDEKEISNLIYHADLTVSPGNVGLTAMHSMVYGTPVVSHNNFIHQMPEFEAIIPWETGAFFNESSVESLADTIHLWFMKCKDRDIVRQRCYSVIDNKYNPYKQIQIFKEVLLK